MRGTGMRVVLLILMLAWGGCSRHRTGIHPPALQNPARTLCPKTADATPLGKALREHNATLGDPVMLRIFKEEKLLELWMRPVDRNYTLIKSYPICRFSGKLGPKQREGDKQAPEGVYLLTARSCNPHSRYCKALDIGYPNRLDRNYGRTGNQIMIHGGCKSIGCFAMTDWRIEEIYSAVESALQNGQHSIYLFIYPFRMTPTNLKRYASSPWIGFWHNLKEGYDLFERKKIPPQVSVRGKKYIFR